MTDLYRIVFQFVLTPYLMLLYDHSQLFPPLITNCFSYVSIILVNEITSQEKSEHIFAFYSKSKFDLLKRIKFPILQHLLSQSIFYNHISQVHALNS